MFRILKQKLYGSTPPQETIDRAQRAQTLLADETFHETLDDLEDEIWQSFFNAAADDIDALVTLYTHANSLKLIKERLTLAVEKGKLEEHIQDQNKR